MSLGNLYIRHPIGETGGIIHLTGNFNSTRTFRITAKDTVEVSYGEVRKIYVSYGEEVQVKINFSSSPATEIFFAGKITKMYFDQSSVNECVIYNMAELTSFEAPYNGISRFELYGTQNISTLDLQLNNIAELDQDLLKKLEYIKLNFMDVSGIDFSLFANLKTMYLVSCELEPEIIGKLPLGVEMLCLKMNRVIQGDFSIFSKLAWLDIASNGVNTLSDVVLPESLKYLCINIPQEELDASLLPEGIEKLDLSGSTNFKKFNNLSRLASLEKLCLAGTALDAMQMCQEWYDLFVSLPKRKNTSAGVLYVSPKSASELASLKSSIPADTNWTINTDGYIPNEF